MKKVVVFGGSGFLGSHVADALSDAGYQVTVFDIHPSPYIQDGQSIVQGDMLDQQLVDELALLWDQYQNRIHKHQKEGVLDQNLEQWRWALEEYRVSLFAQGVKTPYPVSYKRLQKMWQNVAS